MVLRKLGLGDIASLPQLVVCGDQSSGKSSLLKAISGISFPHNDGLCTRFATEVELRRAPQDEISISISIIPATLSPVAEDLKAFRSNITNASEFPAVFEAAKESMGLFNSSHQFSNHVLCIEWSGPEKPPLTIVDVPGLH